MITLNEHITLGGDIIECPVCKSGENIIVESYTTSMNPIYSLGSRYPVYHEPARTSVDAKCVCGASFTIDMIGDKVIRKEVSWDSYNKELNNNNRYYGNPEEDVNNS